jgi:hypothetical protein
VVSGTGADACGFLRYLDAATAVTINYHAHHPNGFAWYAFEMVKGSPPPAHDEGGDVGVGDFTVQWGPFGWGPADPISPARTPSVSDLLGGCVQAAYNMTLWVFGKATNGWGRLGYDAFWPRAFALAPPS